MKITNMLSKLLLLVFIIPAFFLISCKKDEKLNQITYDGKKFNIAGGIIEIFGLAKEDPLSYRMGLTFFSDGLTYDMEIKAFTGQGAILHFNMYSSNSLYLSPGTYIYDSISKNSLTFDWGVMIEDIAFSLAKPDEFDNKFVIIDGKPIVRGTIKVTGDYLGYTITFSGTTSSDKNVKATYKGPLPVVDKRVFR